MKTIKLNCDEVAYIKSSGFLSEELRGLLSNSIKEKFNYYCLVISDELADMLRDLFAEQLQIVGFDDKYHLTEAGQMLEDLIDKFFCG